MPRSARISFVMFSSILSHGGGRETWLNNVLPRLLSDENPPAVDVYFISDAETDAHGKIPAYSDRRVRFIEVRLPHGRGKLTSAARIAIFCKRVCISLCRQPGRQHCVIAVGTFNEGAVIALMRFLCPRRPRLIVWIRGIWLKEISHRHGPVARYVIGRLEAFFLRCSDKLISNGDDTKRHYEALLGRHVEAIPNAIDVRRFGAVRREAFTSSRTVVSFVGRLSEEKGFRDFVRAIERFAASPSGSSVVFDIVGDGPLRYLAESCAQQHPGLVNFVGPVPNEVILDYLETIDVGVCLTYSGKSGGGGVSNGLLELVAARRLVVAWDSEVFRQVLDNTQALFVKEGDVDQLCEAFRRVRDDASFLTPRIANSRAALDRYGLDRHVEHFLAYIRQ